MLQTGPVNHLQIKNQTPLLLVHEKKKKSGKKKSVFQERFQIELFAIIHTQRQCAYMWILM